MSFQMSTMGTGSFAKAMGTGSAVDDAGVSLPRPSPLQSATRPPYNRRGSRALRSSRGTSDEQPAGLLRLAGRAAAVP